MIKIKELESTYTQNNGNQVKFVFQITEKADILAVQSLFRAYASSHFCTDITLGFDENYKEIIELDLPLRKTLTYYMLEGPEGFVLGAVEKRRKRSPKKAVTS